MTSSLFINDTIIKFWFHWKGKINCDATKKIWSSSELIESSKTIANHFQKLGIVPGKIIAFSLSNTVGFPVFLMACLLCGAHPLLLHVGITSYELKTLEETILIDYLLYDSYSIKTSNVLSVTLYDYQFRSVKMSLIKYANNKDTSRFKNFLITPGAILQPSSGTSGHPKICIRTQEAVVAEAKNYISSIQKYKNIRIRLLTNLNHAYAFGFGLISSLLTHSTILISLNFNPKRLLRQETQLPADILAIVPAMLPSLIDLKKINPSYKLPKLIISSGASIEPVLAHEFEKLYKRKIHTIYGTTETGGISSTIGCNPTKISAGKPLKNVYVRLRNIKKYNDINKGTGEIWVKSSSMMESYIYEPKFLRRYFFTGDLGSFDKHGNLQLTGRLREIINVNGVKVSPIKIEQVIFKHKNVLDCAAYPGKSNNDQEVILVAIKLKQQISIDDLKIHCLKYLSARCIPYNFYILKEIPRTVSGKCLKYLLPCYKR